jgi:hypothetical protein
MDGAPTRFECCGERAVYGTGRASLDGRVKKKRPPDTFRQLTALPLKLAQGSGQPPIHSVWITNRDGGTVNKPKRWLTSGIRAPRAHPTITNAPARLCLRFVQAYRQWRTVPAHNRQWSTRCHGPNAEADRARLPAVVLPARAADLATVVAVAMPLNLVRERP